MTQNKYSLKWDNFRLNTASTISELRDDTDFSDMTLACEDRSVVVHRMVLATGSLYFRRLLRQLVHPHPLVYMRGVRAATLEAFLDFLYLGEASLGEEQLNTFLALTKELEVKGLDADGEEYKIYKNETSKKENTKKIETIKDNSYITLDAEEDGEIRIYEENKEGNYITFVVEDELLNEQLDNNQIIKNNDKIKSTTYKKTKVSSAGKILDELSSAALEANSSKTIANPLQSESDLKATIHTLIEKVGKDWSCKVCGKSSSNSGHMRDHVETHIE